MHSSKSVDISGTGGLSSKMTSNRLWILLAGVATLLILITFILSIATLAKVDQSNQNDHTTLPIDSTTTPNNPTLVTTIQMQEVMGHLRELQRIATASNGTRAINTSGFNQTLDYIVGHLTANTDYKISKVDFPVRDFALVNDPILISSIADVPKNYTYSSDLSTAEFYYVKYSTSANFTDFVPLTAIPNGGCADDDWEKANPPPQGRVALIKRGPCPFRNKAILAQKYEAMAVLFYNDGGSPDHIQPIAISLAQNNTVPALFLSFSVGQTLVDAVQDASKNVSIKMMIDVKNSPDFPVGNICADTPTGSVTQTIVIGSHSDSVPAGPGINDNGKIVVSAIFLMFSSSTLFR